MSVDSRVHSELHGLSTMKEMWDNLKAVYASKNMYRKTALIIGDTKIRLSNFNSFNDYIDKIESTHQSLKKIGKDLGDDFVACIMIAGLTEKYESMRMTLQSLPESKITAANIKEKLRSIIKLSSQATPEDFGFLARGHGSFPFRGRRNGRRSLGNFPARYTRNRAFETRGKIQIHMQTNVVTGVTVMGK